MLMAVALGDLNKVRFSNSTRAALCVVMASAGYPATSQKGIPIKGLEHAAALEDTIVYHAGTKSENNTILTNGGRVLGVTALGDSLEQAHDNAYRAVELIHFDGMQYRKDIGYRALKGAVQ
jgi:phosphoribosylamine--glycine ligase